MNNIDPTYNPYMTKEAGFGEMLSGAMPMMGGLMGGAGAGAGIGNLFGGSMKSIAPIIGAAMGAYAASQVDNAIDQNTSGVDLNGQLAVQNGLMNLDQQQALMDPMMGGMGMGPGQGMGMGPGQGMGGGYAQMGMGPGMGQMQGAGMDPMMGQMPPMDPMMGQMPPMDPMMGQMPPMQQPGGVMNGQDAMNTMQKKSSTSDVYSQARASVFAYFNQ